MLTHHAYAIEGSLAQFEAYREALQKSEGFDAHDPNFVVRKFDSFGIDEARELTQLAQFSHVGARALYFVGVAAITSEAQQALLKLFEEPKEGSVFVLMTPHGALLKTLLSRCLPYPHTLIHATKNTEAKAFLHMPYKARSEWIALILKDDEENAREHVRAFFTELEVELYPRLSEGREVREALQEIAHFRQYLSDRSPSLKMLLEHFAATIPQT